MSLLMNSKKLNSSSVWCFVFFIFDIEKDMGVKKGQIHKLEISDIAFGGRGLARVNGLTVFVDQVAPLDLAKVRIVRKRKNYAEARLVELLRPSPHRIDPPCPYSGYCGGCKWQFLEYAKQLEYKRRHVAESLVHIGSIKNVPVRETLPSPQVFGYRNKMEFTCSDRRWLLPDEMGREDLETGFALGLHVPGTFDKVLDTRVCLLQPKRRNAINQDQIALEDPAGQFSVDEGGVE